MPTFGRYEGVRELHRTGITVLWSARAGGAEGFVVKELQARPEIFGEAAAKRSVASFLQRARVQQAAAGEGGGAAWAPVLELQETEEGAYYATRHYARTAQRLVAGRVKIDGAALHAVVSSVVRALRELRERCARAHGNLKPSNVLVEGSGEEPILSALLCDPGEADAATPPTPAADLRAIGDLIHQLVLHQPARPKAWPVPDGPEWQRLGPKGEAWRELCNRLLDPALRDAPPALEEIEQSLSGLVTTRRSRRPLAVLAVVAALLVAGAGAGGYFWIRGHSASHRLSTEYSFETWQQWCDEYDKFVQPLAAEFSGAGSRGPIATDQYWSALSTRLTELTGDLSPPKIFGKTAPIKELRSNEPTSIRSETGVALTKKALASVADIKAMFVPPAVEAWPAYREVKEARETFAKRGWTGPAALLEKPLTLDPKEGVKAIRVVFEAGDTARKLLALDAETQRVDLRATMEEDKVLKQFSGLVTSTLHAAAKPEEIEAARNELHALAAAILEIIDGDVGKKIDKEQLALTPAYAEQGEPTRDRFKAWLAATKDEKNQVPAGDPRPALAETLKNLDRAVESLSAEQEPFRARLDAAKNEVAAIGQDHVRWNGANRDRIVREAAAIDARTLKPLDADLLSARRTQKMGDEEFARLLQEEFRDAPGPVRDAWTNRLAVLTKDSPSRPILRKSTDPLRTFLTGIDQRAPRYKSATSRDWEGELARLYEVRRDDALKESLARANWQQPEPELPADAARPIEALQAWADALGSLASTADSLEKKLNQLFGPDDSETAGLATACRASELYKKEEAVARALDPVLTRYAAAEAARKLAKTADLEGTAQNTKAPVAALIAWRRLAEPDLERAHTLENEAKLQTDLRLMVGTAALLDDRRTALQNELRAGAQARWKRRVEAAATAQEFRDALLLREGLGSDESKLAPRARLNAIVYRLEEAQKDKALDEAGLLKVVTSAAATAKSLGLTDPASTQLIADLDGLLAVQGPTKRDYKTLGPGDPKLPDGVRWTGADTSDTSVRFTRDGATLDFVFVEPAQGAGTLVSATEVSLDLFRRTLAAAGQSEEALRALDRDQTPIDTRKGPRAWKMKGSEVLNDKEWIAWTSYLWGSFNPDPTRQSPYNPSIGARVEAPRPDSPMHRLDPEGALLMARALGCRLPTGAEFSAALALENGGAPFDEAFITASKPNLRDAAWGAQRDFVNGLATSINPKLAPNLQAIRGMISPDAGSYAPPGADPPEPYNDDVLWFAPVGWGSGSRFKNLIGNVAEFVIDQPGPADDLPAPKATHGACSQALVNTGIGIIGWSALSARPPGPPAPVRISGTVRRFSDVGFRLAITAGPAGPPPLATRLEGKLKPSRYLLVSGTPAKTGE